MALHRRPSHGSTSAGHPGPVRAAGGQPVHSWRRRPAAVPRPPATPGPPPRPAADPARAAAAARAYLAAAGYDGTVEVAPGGQRLTVTYTPVLLSAAGIDELPVSGSATADLLDPRDGTP
jgi:hypothetical protein